MLVLLVSLFLFKKANQAIALFPIVLLIYVPLSYYIDRMMYQRYQRIKAKERQARRNARVSGLDVRSFTVGPVQENSYIVRASADERARGDRRPGRGGGAPAGGGCVARASRSRRS